MPVPPISQLPIAPQVTDTPAVFSNRANTFVAALAQLVTETNATTAEINQALAGALVLFDGYQGDWEAGSYGEGDVVRKDGVFYISLVDSNTQEPPDSNWQELLTAAQTSFDPSASGLSALNVQAAIDEVQGGLGTMAQQNANNVNINGGNITASAITSGTLPSARLDGAYEGVGKIAGLISDDSDTGEVTTAHGRAVLASEDSQASARASAVIAGIDCEATQVTSAVVASERSISGAFYSSVIGSDSSEAAGPIACNVISSESVKNPAIISLALGAGSGAASTSNRKIHLFGSSGNIQIAGSLTSNASFSDFAEMMPNGTGAEIPAGTILTIDNGEVRPANEGDDICGVVSHTGAVLAGDTPFCWQGRYLCDEFGRRIYETIPEPKWKPGEGQTEANRPTRKVLKENPEWDPNLPQVPRSERPDEWTPVGMIGQVYVRTGEAVQSGDKLKSVAGVGFKSTERTGLRVMAVTKEYDGDYGIARCMLNVIV